MTADGDLVLGYDVGTSAVRLALFDSEGEVVARGREPYPLLLPAPGWAEQRPDDWWRAMCVATRRLLADSELPRERIAAVAIAAQMTGAVAVDRDGVALHNALIWLDTRSEPIARRLTGGAVRVGGYGLGALARWLWRTNGAPNARAATRPRSIFGFGKQCRSSGPGFTSSSTSRTIWCTAPPVASPPPPTAPI